MSDRERADDGERVSRREAADDTPVVDLHEPIYREMAEPRDGFEPAPTWLVFFCLAIMGFGGWYLGMYSGGFRPDVYNETGWQGAAVATEATEQPGLDPMILGKRIYNNCMACHQRDGRGVPGNYPPLDGSEWLAQRPAAVTALVLHGLEGEVEVEGDIYNQVMPKWGHFTDEQVAAVLTFVRQSWSNSFDPIEPSYVAAVREATSDRVTAWTAGELLEFDESFVEPIEEPADEPAEQPAEAMADADTPDAPDGISDVATEP